MPQPRRKRGWPGILALVLALLLAPVAVYEGYLLLEMDKQLDQARSQAEADRLADDSRLDGVEKRADAVEKQLGNQFNASAIADAALPSVFRVRAGDFSGTAFAVGKEPAANVGGTYLFTNYHVIQQVWDRGDREVHIERGSTRFPVTIKEINKGDDVALLVSKEKFPRLATATEKVKSGAQIVVVGAPLGLEGSVTSGVVSAFRKVPDYAGEMMQFDAPINPGNSGGPVVNAQKQVVGIASAKAREAEGIGLAVQISTACTLMKIC